MRRWLILVSIVCLFVQSLATTLIGFWYLIPQAGTFSFYMLIGLANTLVATVLAAVLVARFRDIWSRRVAIDEPVSNGIARLAQVSGVALMVIFYLTLAFILVSVRLDPDVANRASTLFVLAPLLAALPLGYFLFEFGRLIDKDRRDAWSE